MEMKGNNIDNLFKEELFELEVTPPEEIWANISRQIQEKKSKKLIVLWYRIAAGMTILIASTWVLIKTLNKENTATQTIVNNEQQLENNQNKNGYSYNPAPEIQPEKITSQNKKSIGQQKFATNNTTPNDELKKNIQIEKNESSKKNTILTIKTKEEQFENVINNNESYKKEYSLDKLAMLGINLDRELPEEHVLYMSPELNIVNKKRNKGEWEVGGYYAPLYTYRALETGESDLASSTMTSNAEQGQYTYSGGFTVNYKITNRLSIGTGLSVVNHSYKISNVAALTTYNNLAYSLNGKAGEQNNQAYSVNNSIGQIAASGGVKVYSKSKADYDPSLTAESQSAINNSYVLPDNQVINQSFDYMEVPLLLRYKLIDRALGLHLVSGLSSYFLVNNKVTIKSPDQPDITGETVDIKSTNISGSLGLGLNYSLSKNLSLNMEPLFKIFLNSINTSNSLDVHPYSFGIYSGIFYSF